MIWTAHCLIRLPSTLKATAVRWSSFGFTVDYDYYAAYCNGSHYRAFLQPLMGGSPSAEDVERVHDLKKQYYAASMDIARKNEALFVILEALRPTHYLAVITTGSRQNATEMLDHFHCTDWFDLILTQEDVVNNKPDPELPESHGPLWRGRRPHHDL